MKEMWSSGTSHSTFGLSLSYKTLSLSLGAHEFITIQRGHTTILPENREKTVLGLLLAATMQECPTLSVWMQGTGRVTRFWNLKYRRLVESRVVCMACSKCPAGRTQGPALGPRVLGPRVKPRRLLDSSASKVPGSTVVIRVQGSSLKL